MRHHRVSEQFRDWCSTLAVGGSAGFFLFVIGLGVWQSLRGTAW